MHLEKNKPILSPPLVLKIKIIILNHKNTFVLNVLTYAWTENLPKDFENYEKIRALISYQGANYIYSNDNHSQREMANYKNHIK